MEDALSTFQLLLRMYENTAAGRPPSSRVGLVHDPSNQKDRLLRKAESKLLDWAKTRIMRVAELEAENAELRQKASANLG